MALALDDRRLVQAHQAGDTEVFAEIVERYRRPLTARAGRLLGDPHAAEDAVQETFLRAYRALPRFNGEYRLGGWLRRILENVCADEGNRRRREQVLVERWAAMPPTGVDRREPAAVVDELAEQRRLGSAWRRLSDDHREALALRFVHGCSYAEAADATGVSEEAVRARVSRARTALRGMLGAASALVTFAATFGRRAERAVALGAERVAVSPAMQPVAEVSTSFGAAKVGAVAAAIGVAAASLAVPAGLVGNSDRSPAPRVPTRAVAAGVLDGGAATVQQSAPEPEPDLALPAPSQGPSRREAGIPAPVVEAPTSADPVVDLPAPAPVAVAPVVPSFTLPAGLGELVLSLEGITFSGQDDRLEAEGVSSVVAGDAVLMGDVEIRLRLATDGESSAQGKLRGRFELPEGAGSARVRGELVATEGSSYRFEGEIRLPGGESVPFSAEVVVPAPPSSGTASAAPSPGPSTPAAGVEVVSTGLVGGDVDGVPVGSTDVHAPSQEGEAQPVSADPGAAKSSGARHDPPEDDAPPWVA